MHLMLTLLLTFAGGIPVVAHTLDGESSSGSLVALTPSVATVEVNGAAQDFSLADLHELKLQEVSNTRPPSLSVRLQDGSHFGIEAVTIAARAATLKSQVLGELEIPRSMLSSIRLSKLDNQVASAWNELSSRETRDDLVVIRKGDALDHVGGVVSGIDDEAVRLLLDGSPVPIPRERVFGVVLAPTDGAAESTATGHLDLSNGDRLAVRSITLEDDSFTAVPASGGQVVIAAADIARIDFSLGKIAYLVDREPLRVKYPTEHQFFLPETWGYRKGETSTGKPLVVGRETSERGLWIHSGTTLAWRLSREYRSFRATTGIPEGLGEGCDPTIGVIIRGDGEELAKFDLSRGDKPRAIDLDVASVRELEISVTSTNPDGICEHLGLAEARLIK